jgi:hypothetical protein
MRLQRLAKQLQVYGILVVCFLMQNQFANAQTNYMPNPDFATNTNGWNIKGSPTNTLLHSTDGALTPNSALYDITTTNGKLSNGVLKSPIITVPNSLQGKEMYLGIYAKASVSTTMTLRVHVTLADGTTQNTKLNNLPLTTSFEKYTLLFNLPSDAQSMNVTILCGKDIGQYYFDDAAITRLEPFINTNINYVNNGDFVANTNGWSIKGNSGTLSHSTESATTPNSALYTVTTTGGKLKNAELRSNVYSLPSDAAGKYAYFSLYAKSDAPETIKIFVQEQKTNGSKVNNKTSVLNLTTNFEKYTLPISLSDDAQSVYIFIRCGANTGNYYFDDVALHPIEKEINTLTNYIPNFDFINNTNDWSKTGNSNTLTHSSHSALTPNSALYTVNSSNGKINNAQFKSMDIPVPNEIKGKKMLFSIHAKANEQDIMKIFVQEKKVDGSKKTSKTSDLTLSTGFEKYDLLFDITDNAQSVRVTIQCGLDTGQYYFDDAALVVAEVNPKNIQQFNHWTPRYYTPPINTTTQTLPSTGSATVQVTINPTEIVAPILPTQFGVNSNFRSGSGLVSRTPLYQDFGSFRFPAGSGSNQYFWDGNIPSNTAITISPINGTKSKDFNPDEFVTFKNNANGEATVVVNYFYARYGTTPSGTRADRVQQAADYAASLVAYLNDTLNANVKYWEIGNECYGSWEKGYNINGSIVTGTEYGEDFRVFAQTMKAVDPTIWVGAVLSNNSNSWNSQILHEVQDHADFLIVHHYFNVSGSGTAKTAATAIAEDMQEIQIAVGRYTNKPAGYFPVAFTEYNVAGSSTTNMKSGLFMAEALATIVENRFTLATAWVNEWNLDGTGNHSHGLLAKNDWRQADFTPRPSYTPFYYFGKNFGDQMIEANLTGDDKMRAYASTFSSSEIGVVILNYEDTSKSVAVDFVNTMNVDTAYWYTVHADNVNAGNTKFYVNGTTSTTSGGGPDLDNVAANFAVLTDSSYFTLPKYSATYLVLQPKASTKRAVINPSNEDNTSQEQENKIHIYPNPAKHMLNIETASGGLMQVFDGMGKLVIERQIATVDNVDISQLPNGMYYVKVGNVVQKVIIQK